MPLEFGGHVGMREFFETPGLTREVRSIQHGLHKRSFGATQDRECGVRPQPAQLDDKAACIIESVSQPHAAEIDEAQRTGPRSRR